MRAESDVGDPVATVSKARHNPIFAQCLEQSWDPLRLFQMGERGDSRGIDAGARTDGVKSHEIKSFEEVCFKIQKSFSDSIDADLC